MENVEDKGEGEGEGEEEEQWLFHHGGG